MAISIIYDGFFNDSTLVKVRVIDGNEGDSVFVYDEDSMELLGSSILEFEDVDISVDPLNCRRIISFVGSFGQGTAGGVDVTVSNNTLTGWETPEPVNEESVPVEIGLYNPGALNPITARYNSLLVNDIPSLYKAAAIELLSEPIVFDTLVTYKVDPSTDDKIAIISVTGVKNTRGAYTVTIGGISGDSRTYTADGIYPVVVTDSEGRVSTKQININPASGYMPVAPSPPASSIKMYMMSADFGGGVYFARADARSTSPLEVSYDGGATYSNMNLGGSTSYGSLKSNIPPGSITITIRVIGNPTDFVTETIPVPYP